MGLFSEGPAARSWEPRDFGSLEKNRLPVAMAQNQWHIQKLLGKSNNGF